MPEDDTDLRKKVQDVWGSTLSGVELPGQSIKPAAARQTMPAPGTEPVRLPTVPLGTPEGEAPSRPPQIEILDVIGEGGMGTIYRARQVSLEREVALKRIKPHLEMRQDVVDMFLGEAHATGALDHPNIVPVYELGRDDKGQAFYSMKLVHGTPWNKLLHPETDEQRARADSMSVRDHLDILLKASDAIGFAHSRGVIHRDLKPENVMVGEFGEVLVMDWGLAAAVEPGQPATRRLPDVTKITAACGTPSYMPPEMALGEGFRTCPASDVYLLGAILEKGHKEVDYEITVPVELLHQRQQTQETFNLVMLLVAGLTLLVGGVGIVNIMLVSVAERTKEIGIRRALGARRQDIMLQMLVETVALTLTGGVLGVLVGFAGVYAIGAYTGWAVLVTPWAVLGSLLVSIAAGVFFGLYPARRAASISPLTALRYE